MGRNISIIVGAALIAAVLAIVSRWEVSIGPGAVYRLDRWTGTLTRCDDQWEQVKPIPGGPIRVDYAPR